MKFVFVLVLIASSIVFDYYTEVFAMCAQNQDWPNAPCFDMMPVNREEYRNAWAPYYDYKGQEWMGIKKAEMFEARQDGKLAEWMDENISHSNVFSYYHSRGEISFPAKYDYFFFEDEALWHSYIFPNFSLFILMISIVAGSATLSVVMIKRHKK